MSLSYNTNVSSLNHSRKNINFRANELTNASAPLAKPIETVQKTLEETVDTFVPVKDEKERKSNKKAIAVGSSVLVITSLVALLNPKNSSKLANKLKSWSQKSAQRLEKSKNDYLASKFHKGCQKTFDWGLRTLQFSNNVNSAKDIGFMWLCCEKKAFSGVKNKTLRNILQKIDGWFTKVMSKIHTGITKWFDKISQKTVRMEYNSAAKKMDKFEALVKEYKTKLPEAQQRELETKLAEISKAREIFTDSNLTQRFAEQENLMANLERDFLTKFRSYRKGFTNKWVRKGEHIDKNMTFWAEEILMPTRNGVEQKGLNAVEKVMGNGKGQKGLYEEVCSILNPNLNAEEQKALNKAFEKASKKLNKANNTECVKYFDKKRDLVLGGAPTDILTAVFGLGFSGIAIATADNKEQRMSRLLTGVFPVVAGIGTSIAFTAMLFSGVQGLLLGFATSIGLSKIGSLIDHHLLGNKNNDTEKSSKPTELTKTSKEAVHV